eukprot:gene17882-21328_t
MITGDNGPILAKVDEDSLKKSYQTLDINSLKNMLKKLLLPPVDGSKRIECLFEYHTGSMNRYKDDLSKVYRIEFNTIKENSIVPPFSDLYFIGSKKNCKDMEVLSLHTLILRSAPGMKTERSVLENGAVYGLSSSFSSAKSMAMYPRDSLTTRAASKFKDDLDDGLRRVSKSIMYWVMLCPAKSDEEMPFLSWKPS